MIGTGRHFRSRGYPFEGGESKNGGNVGFEAVLPLFLGNLYAAVAVTVHDAQFAGRQLYVAGIIRGPARKQPTAS